jgi:hypothetical protein
MKLHPLALLAVLSTLTAHASATTTDWGHHDALEVASSTTPVGSFSDSYMFTVGTPSSIASSAVSNNLGSLLGLTGGTVTLFADAPGVDPTVGTYSFSGTFASLLAGSYYYVVSGIGTGASGGFYALASSVSAVPEPETLALMLAGLGIVGFKASRRKLED